MTVNGYLPGNPLHVANMAHRMAENTHGAGSRAFQSVALVIMGISAVASLGSVLYPLLRELNCKHDRARGSSPGR